MARPTVAIIDRQALRDNFMLAQSLAPDSQSMPMVKANLGSPPLQADSTIKAARLGSRLDGQNVTEAFFLRLMDRVCSFKWFTDSVLW